MYSSSSKGSSSRDGAAMASCCRETDLLECVVRKGNSITAETSTVRVAIARRRLTRGTRPCDSSGLDGSEGCETILRAPGCVRAALQGGDRTQGGFSAERWTSKGIVEGSAAGATVRSKPFGKAGTQGLVTYALAAAAPATSTMSDFALASLDMEDAPSPSPRAQAAAERAHVGGRRDALLFTYFSQSTLAQKLTA
eukprot:scaffold35632_cov32-Tisochrysis_lutea.AAC.1